MRRVVHALLLVCFPVASFADYPEIPEQPDWIEYYYIPNWCPETNPAMAQCALAFYEQEYVPNTVVPGLEAYYSYLANTYGINTSGSIIDQINLGCSMSQWPGECPWLYGSYAQWTTIVGFVGDRITYWSQYD